MCPDRLCLHAHLTLLSGLVVALWMSCCGQLLPSQMLVHLPRNLFNTSEIAPRAEPLTSTPGLTDGAQAGLDGTPLQEVRHGDGEGGTIRRPHQQAARPFCATCQDVWTISST